MTIATLNSTPVYLKDKQTGQTQEALSKATLKIDGVSVPVMMYPSTFTAYKKNSAFNGQTLGPVSAWVNTATTTALTSATKPQKVTIEFDVALRNDDNVADPEAAFVKHATVTLDDATIVAYAEDAMSHTQTVSISWSNGSISEAVLTDGEMGGDATYALFPAAATRF